MAVSTTFDGIISEFFNNIPQSVSHLCRLKALLEFITIAFLFISTGCKPVKKYNLNGTLKKLLVKLDCSAIPPLNLPWGGLVRNLHSVPDVLPVALSHMTQQLPLRAPDGPGILRVRTLLGTAVVELVCAINAEG